MKQILTQNTFSMIALAFFALVFSACAATPNHLVYNQKQSTSLGFNVDENSVLKNPTQDQIRVYAVSFGFINFDLYANEATELQGDTLINLGAFRLFSGDFSKNLSVEENKPLALVTSSTDFGQYSFLYFTPTRGKIYCVAGEIINGAWVGRPNISFLTKEECEYWFSE